MLRTLSTVRVGLILTFATVALVAGEPAKRRITVEEIQKSIVIGRLGMPLGEIVTVKLRWDPTFKPSDMAIVTEVDGRTLDPPVEFWSNPPRPPLDEKRFNIPRFEYEREYLLRVYETGGFFGIRYEWLKEQGQGPVQSIGYAFLPELELIRSAPDEPPQPSREPAQRPTRPRITIDEIRNATVFGRLGVPLGDVVTLRIQWKTYGGGKINDELIVTERNGERLDPPVVFHADMPSRIDERTGEYVEIFLWDRDYLVRAYETAGFSGLCDGLFKETGELLQGRGFHFRERVIFLQDASRDHAKPRNAGPPTQK